MVRFLVSFLIISLNFCSQTPKNLPSPAKGTLDLQNWEFESKPGSLNQDKLLKLDGEWEFYWMNLIDPQDFYMIDPCTLSQEKCRLIAENKRYLKIPSLWNDVILDPINSESTNSEKLILSNTGYGTYRLKIFNVKEKILSIYLFYINTSYKLFINGQLIEETGKVGTQKSESTPSQKSL